MKHNILKNGVVTVGESDKIHQRDILIAHKVWFKNFPLLGVGIDEMINEDDTSDLSFKVETNFNQDNMQVDEIYFDDNDKLIVNAKYNS
jgi:hypothetical protein